MKESSYPEEYVYFDPCVAASDNMLTKSVQSHNASYSLTSKHSSNPLPQQMRALLSVEVCDDDDDSAVDARDVDNADGVCDLGDLDSDSDEIRCATMVSTCPEHVLKSESCRLHYSRSLSRDSPVQEDVCN